MEATIALVTPYTMSHRTAEETLALGYLGSILREAGYHVVIVDGWLEALSRDELVARIFAEGPPALVGMSCYRSNLDQASEVLQALRIAKPGLPAFAGGYGPTFHSADFLEAGFDVAVMGEAEHIIVSLVRTLMSGSDLRSVPGLAYKDAGRIVTTRRSEPIADLDTLPFPAKDSVVRAIASHNYVHMCTARGCGGYCSYCSISAFAVGGSRQLRWRGRGVMSVVDEIEYLYRTFDVRHFKFVDDSFIEPPRDEQWARTFRDELVRRDLHIRFRTQVRADLLTPGIVETLAAAGWFSTAVGIENAAPTALLRMLKQARPEDNERALQLLERNGVYVQMGMILFDPDTTLDELQINLEFLRRHPWPFTKGVFTEMFAADGTPFTRRLAARGLLQKGTVGQNHAYQVHDPSARRVHAMLKIWHRAHSKVYDWVIDSLTAPKVVPDAEFRQIHRLCQRLQQLDLDFFEAVMQLVRIESDISADDAFAQAAIAQAGPIYLAIKHSIGGIYSHLGFSYDAVANPFLDNDNKKTGEQDE